MQLLKFDPRDKRNLVGQTSSNLVLNQKAQRSLLAFLGTLQDSELISVLNLAIPRGSTALPLKSFNQHAISRSHSPSDRRDRFQDAVSNGMLGGDRFVRKLFSPLRDRFWHGRGGSI